MPEWWTYSLADFLMFAPRTYYRLVESFNRSIWPLNVVALAAGVALSVLAATREGIARRAIPALLALAWIAVAWLWFEPQLSTIHWGASWMTAAFTTQALLLAAFAARREGLSDVIATSMRRRVALIVTALGAVAYPLAAPLTGHSLRSAETFGLLPDPTVIATLGVLAVASRGARFVLIPIPLAWAAFAAATLWTMDSPLWAALPLAAAVALLKPRLRPA